MRKLIFTTTLLMTAACTKEVPDEEVTANTVAAREAKATQPVIKEISITASNPEAIEQYTKGRELVDNARSSEAVAYFAKAMELDPGFARAHAALGMATPGAEGLKHLETAATMTANLPEEERTLIELMIADRKGDEAKVTELQTKLGEAAPTDWRVHDMIGNRALRNRDFETAANSFRKAIELSPSTGSVHNHLGYALLEQGKKDEAIAAFKKYAELSPSEPNPHDSLGDALLASGKLEEAEAAYTKATEVAPSFWFAWNGVATTRALRGNWQGAEEALAKGRDAAAAPIDKAHANMDIAWILFTQGKTKEALKALDEIEKQAQADKIDPIHASVALHRAAMLTESGKAKDAIMQIEAGWERAEKAGLPGAMMTHLRVFGLHVRAIAESKLGKKDELVKTVAAFEEEAKKDPANARLVSTLHDIQGLTAMAAGDSKAALEHFAQCMESDALCAYHRVEVEEKAGNKAGADAIREKLTASPQRDLMYAYVRSKLGTITAPQ